ncbi:beta-ketoacyl-[acyl-carrier-protein] synthase family protein [Amycolatopsis thailandensis]|uniref:beta-ketoacyl-[acyl-carrier-protein] synthase family protein n=1 Tax=Amycolatopsis thailandensis TaxID=589330 RepID=UPI0037B598FA
MTPPEVVVTGIGVVSAAGVGVDENWKRIVSGEPTADHDPELDGLPVDFACRVPDFNPVPLLGTREAGRTDRYTQLALVAAHEALTSSRLRLENTDSTRAGVVLGTVSGGSSTMERQEERLLLAGSSAVSVRTMPMGLVNMAAGVLSIHFGLQGIALTTATACASGTNAIGVARDLIRSGAMDVVLAGGTDAPITPLSSAAFHRLGALSRRCHDPAGASRPFSADRDGFVLGEGAGILVLENERHARARQAPRLAKVAGYGASADSHHVTRPHPEGAGARRCMRAAIADAGLAPADIGHVNAHGTSTRLNDEVENAAIASIFGDQVAVTSTKGVTGHPFGAAGALEAAYSVLTLTTSVIPPTANLTEPDPRITVDVVAGTARHRNVGAVISNSFGFGGHNASLVFTAA